MNDSIINTVVLSQRYCSALENAREYEKKDFITEMLDILPRLYLAFSDDIYGNENEFSEYNYYPDYVDEEFYDSVRRNIENLMGEDDTFLETFEQDMKYSDTPIASSVSECLADIFQPLYNFISLAKESEMNGLEGILDECKEQFISYWSQTLCNVMRPLNNIKYNL